VFATATPVANSMAELWVMQTYLHPDQLASVDLRRLRRLGRELRSHPHRLELAPDGASYRMQTRFARFQNVPELLTLYRQVADVRTLDDLDLPVPCRSPAARPRRSSSNPATSLVDYVADLASHGPNASATGPSTRARTTCSRSPATAAAPRSTSDSSAKTPRPTAASSTWPHSDIAAIHHATRDHRYADDHGQLTLRPGALQLVFCDVSTPAADGWNAYDELRALLSVRRGVEAGSIRYMQDAKTDQAKAKLFAACRDGTVAVLIGSTETMGVGTNVQTRAIAMHHLDAPWRPADIEQRDGRILRQGNQNPEVRVLRYVTEGSFDTYMWQTLERKAAFIAQVTRGDLPDRDVDDIGDQALSFAEVKALATGDPLVLEKAAVDADVARLTRLERAHHDDQHRLRRTYDTATPAPSEGRAPCQAPRRPCRSSGRHPRRTLRHDHRRAIATPSGSMPANTSNASPTRLDQTPPETNGPTVEIGTLAGLTVTAQAITTIEDEIRVAIPDAHIEVTYPALDWKRSDPPTSSPASNAISNASRKPYPPGRSLNGSR
jgi:hypothetical protein